MNGAFLPMHELAERIRQHPVRRGWMPLEYRTSWWVPVQNPQDGRLYLAGFFYPVITRPGQGARIGRPQFHFTVEPATGQFVEVTDCSFRDFAVHLAPDPVLGTVTPDPKEDGEAPRSELYQAYDLLLPAAFREPDSLTPEQREAVGRFRKAFERVVEPCLLPYYQAVNPAFFEWLERVT